MAPVKTRMREYSMKNMFLLLSVLGLLVASNAFATSTSGVHGPTVNPDDKSFMYRIAYSPGEDEGPDRYAHRLHYQEAYNDRIRWRVISQFRDRGGDQSFELDYIRAELLWHFRPKQNDNWDSGVRFDIRSRKGSRPELFAINWTNQWQLSPKWRLRGIVIGGWNFGGTAVGGTTLETRSSLSYKLDNGHRVGVEMFNEFGRISDMGSFNDQDHAIGPVVSGKLGGLGYQLGYLAGVSNGASDHSFRLWFNKAF